MAAADGFATGLEAGRLEHLWREIRPRLLLLARRLTRDHVGAEDVLQRAFEQAWRHAGRFRGDAAPTTWLYRIVVNQGLMWLREERRRARRMLLTADGEVDGTAHPGADALHLLLRAERVALARGALARLPERDRQLLLRSVEERRSYAALAGETGQHVAALKSRAFRARRRLAEELAAIESRGAAAGSGRQRVASRLPEGQLEEEPVRCQRAVRVAHPVAEVLDRAARLQEVQ